MPNHVTTEITGPHLALASLLDDTGKVDFTYLIPLPEGYEEGGCSGQHAPGVVCWYEWNTENWGTKWNAYDSEVSEGKVRFDTAWSHPFPVIKALIAKHPDETFEVKYADEDLGSNLGHYIVKEGTVIECSIGDANEFAAQVKYGRTYAELQAEWGDDED